ncbi:MAG TPA: amidohydrolase [Ktedonobacteraceae bacterium]|nr:amidohydrolase [Ktedonobacteraceae bacterium]
MSTIIYLNGNIYTMDATQPRARAMAVDTRSGRILAIGENDEVRRVGGQQTELVDLRGQTVLPGFIDAHIHLLSTAYRAHYIDAADCQSEEEVAELVRQRAAQTPAGQWIQGGRWYKGTWPGQRFPGKASLDAAAPAHPVALWSKDGHLLWVNSLALQRAGIDEHTPDPANGAILRDSSGQPSGILQEEEATNLVYRVIDKSDPVLTRHLVRQSLGELLRAGITTIHDIEGSDALDLFQRLRDDGELGVRVQMILPRQALPELQALGLRAGFGDDMLRLAGIKIFADGTLGSQTAAMLAGFEGNPDNRGILALPEAAMMETVSTASELGLSIAIHAIGDRAVHVALNSIERAQQRLHDANQQQTLARLRYRVEHAQLVAPEDLERMRRLGVVASVQPFHAVADRDLAERYWGRRARRAYAYRTMQEMGIPLALGSDAPVETFDPLQILYAAIQRNDPTTPERAAWMPEQALPVVKALWGYTLGAAYAAGEERDKGSLIPGKLGDAVVLRDDLLTIEPAKLRENGVAATIVGGQVLYGEV